FVCETAALHSLVLSMGQSLLQNGLFQRGKVKAIYLVDTFHVNPQSPYQNLLFSGAAGKARLGASAVSTDSVGKRRRP
ncbi:hypothetical protein, partial [Rhizobium sp. BK661]|uniref:hypothetical protein n=1 Tax=Rhizobium sp. BK661 TaxID=2586991 RepID=UPI002169CB5E